MNSASLCSLAGRYNNPIPPRFLAPKDCLKIPALGTKTGEEEGWGAADQILLSYQEKESVCKQAVRNLAKG